jgi:hypothetical protein
MERRDDAADDDDAEQREAVAWEWNAAERAGATARV